MILSNLGNEQRNGFTMAELLITLAIIGIVAALTIPSLVQKYKERALITSLKKFYSTFSQAVNLAVANEGYEFTSQDVVKYLKTEKVCEQTNEGCTDIQRKYMNGVNIASFGPYDAFKSSVDYVKLIDGTIIRLSRKYNCARPGEILSYCGEFAVDINGDAVPNILGQDVFYFYNTPKGVIPFGYRGDTRTPFSACANKSGAGYQCTAWIIENENMDYLRCDDLSWEGKHKCSK